MLIHSYLTNGNVLVEFAKVFLKSLKIFNGEKYSVLFDGRDLSKDQIEQIKKHYKNLTIINKKINYDKIAEDIGVSKQRLMDMKKNVELKDRNVGPSRSVPWKQAISVEDRYRNSIKDALLYCKENNIKHMANLDIDTGFYRSFEPIENIIKNHDVTLQWRLKRGKDGQGAKRLDKTKIYGGITGYTCNENAFKFLDKWIEIIDKIPLKKKPKGYGQLSLFYTWKQMHKIVDFGIIPPRWTRQKFHFERWMKNYGEPYLYNGGKGNKKKNIEIFSNILKKYKNVKL